MPGQLKLSAITLDCADPLALAAFYQQATGLPLHEKSDAEFAGLLSGPGLLLGFQRVADYRRPQWPGQDQPQQFHLDFDVTDLAAATEELLALGATRPADQPGNGGWLVLLDPAGHPFCLIEKK
ncbi:VOC family protein [Kitasatospora sp. NPDC058965]|uniref:VOC family protein n=1 Tax=Kitasatospora sp. NPDC058965 TaxID=3346682 RepID=UPI0036858C95